MNVTDLFQRLSYGELSNLAIGFEGAGTIPEASRPKIISYLNEGLLSLYSRFVLKESSLILELSDFITSYQFTKRFARSNATPTAGDTLYIVDHIDDPYKGDLIKVLQVTNGIGERYPLNDPDNTLSMFTPQPNVLQVPNPQTGQVLGVVYQAMHEEIAYDDYEACIQLPVVLERALLSFIAHKVYHHMNGQENAAKANEYLGIYDGICQEIVDRDLVNSSSSSTGMKFHDRGFV